MGVGGDGAGGEVVVDGGGTGCAVASGEVGGGGGGDEAVPRREGRAPSAEARGVPGAPVLLRSPRRTHRLGRMRARRWFMSLTSDNHSE